MKEKILVVDDDADELDTLKFALAMEEYEVLTATNGQDALKVLRSAAIDLVVTDIKMPVMNGMELMRHIRDFDDEIEIIALTGHATVEIAVEALKNGGAFDFLRKPMEDVNQLFFTIEKALERRRLRHQNKRIHIALKASERFNQAIIDSLPFNILVLDKSGVILKANRTWQDFVSEQFSSAGIGGNFFETCGSRIDDKEVISGIRSVLNGEAKRFEKEFLCKHSSPEKWFLLQACCLENGTEQTVISQVDITRDRKSVV
jgi:CheY-like chemotaxis protein